MDTSILPCTVSQLKPIVPGHLAEETAPAKCPNPLEINGERAYIISVSEVMSLGGSLEYLVDWEGYDSEGQSWLKAKDNLSPLLI